LGYRRFAGGRVSPAANQPRLNTHAAAYIYEVAAEHVISINGAGWNFYDGVWDKLYDVCGMRWHEYAHA
jgi:hypothetical protein